MVIIARRSASDSSCGAERCSAASQSLAVPASRRMRSSARRSAACRPRMRTSRRCEAGSASSCRPSSSCTTAARGGCRPAAHRSPPSSACFARADDVAHAGGALPSTGRRRTPRRVKPSSPRRTPPTQRCEKLAGTASTAGKQHMRHHHRRQAVVDQPPVRQQVVGPGRPVRAGPPAAPGASRPPPRRGPGKCLAVAAMPASRMPCM